MSRRRPRAPALLRAAPTLLVALLALAIATGSALEIPAWISFALVAPAAWAWRLASRSGQATRALVALAFVVLATGLGWGAARGSALRPIPVETSRSVSGALVTIDRPPSHDRRGRWRALVVANRVVGLRPGARLLVDLPGGVNVPPRPGMRLRVDGVLRPPTDARSPDWWAAYLARLGVAGRIRAQQVTEVGHRGGLAGVRDRWREWVRGRAGDGLAGDTKALVSGMAIGATESLSQDAADELRTTGLWHLVAVSGQNVALVSISVIVLLGALGVRRKVVLVSAIAFVVAYCLACDGGASVARAGVMGAVGLVAMLRGSPRSAWHALAVGLAVLLAWSPPSLGDPGLQLSFAAVVGLLALAPAATRLLGGWLPERLVPIAGQSVAAALATSPVLVWQFGRLSVIGIALNLVAVPLAGPTVVLAVGGIALGAVWSGAGFVATWFAGIGADVLLALAHVGAALPGASFDVPSAAIPLLVVLALVPPALSLWLDQPASARSARPAGAGVRPGVVLVLTLPALVLAVPFGGTDRPWPVRPTVTVLDIGQGDAVLLQSPDGHAALVDTGPPGTPPPVIAALARHGVHRLDVLVLTHAQSDHIGAAADILKALKVGSLERPPLPDSAAVMDRATQAAGRHNVPVDEVRAGAVVTLGEWRLNIRWPRDTPARGGDPNDTAIVIEAEARGMRVLLTSDAEGPVLIPAGVGRADVLKVSHHGSADGELGPLLQRVRPRVALISVGAGNTFGHPRAETLATLAAAGVQTWRTDRQGDLSVAPGPTGPEVSTGR